MSSNARTINTEADAPREISLRFLPNKGDRIELVSMVDPDPVPAGSTGTVTDVLHFGMGVPVTMEGCDEQLLADNEHIDEKGHATITVGIHVDWDDFDEFRDLLLPVDQFRILEEQA